jgi:hypothetical protein
VIQNIEKRRTLENIVVNSLECILVWKGEKVEESDQALQERRKFWPCLVSKKFEKSMLYNELAAALFSLKKFGKLIL